MDTTVFARICRKKALQDLARLKLLWRLFFLFFLLAFSFLGIAYGAWSLVYAVFLRLFSSALPTETFIVSAAITLLGGLFLLSPLWRGVQALLLHRFLYGETDFSLLFYFFSHRGRYAFSLRRSFRGFLRLSLFLLLLDAGARLGSVVGNWLLLSRQPTVALLVGLLSLGFVVLLLFVFSLWNADSFLMDAAFLTAPLLSYRQLHALSARKMKRGRGALRRLNLSFLPLWIVSVLLLGIPLVFVVPYYITSRSHLAAFLIRN